MRILQYKKTQYEYKHVQIFQQQNQNESYVKHVKMKKHNNETIKDITMKQKT